MRLLLLLGGLAIAQSPAPTPSPAPTTPSATPAAPSPGAPGAATPTPPSPDPAADASLLRGLDLPGSARKLRDAGVPEADVKNSLDAMKGAGVSAGDAAEVTDATVTDVTEHGPIDNFGAFVQEKLAAGLRGRELAEAIKAEHTARGKGKPDHAGGPPDGKGPDGEHPGRGGKGPGGPGGPGHEGKAGEHGRPGMGGEARPAERGGRPEGGKRGGAGGNGKGAEKENEK